MVQFVLESPGKCLAFHFFPHASQVQHWSSSPGIIIIGQICFFNGFLIQNSTLILNMCSFVTCPTLSLAVPSCFCDCVCLKQLFGQLNWKRETWLCSRPMQFNLAHNVGEYDNKPPHLTWTVFAFLFYFFFFSIAKKLVAVGCSPVL